jgi:hypothetical protein
VTFEQWIQKGIDTGWCGPAICAIHDGVPSTAAEDETYDDGGDPCIHIVRLYGTDQVTRKAVERNHPPSVWRK